jgi:hypothetical protein
MSSSVMNFSHADFGLPRKNRHYRAALADGPFAVFPSGCAALRTLSDSRRPCAIPFPWLKNCRFKWREPRSREEEGFTAESQRAQRKRKNGWFVGRRVGMGILACLNFSSSIRQHPSAFHPASFFRKIWMEWRQTEMSAPPNQKSLLILGVLCVFAVN